MRCHRTLACAVAVVIAVLAGAPRMASAQEDVSAKVEQLFREGVDLFRMAEYEKAQAKLQQALELDPNAAEAWRLVKMAGDRVLIQMMTDQRMGREPRVVYELYRLHEKRLQRKVERIKRLVAVATDPLEHPTKRWRARSELAEVGQFTIPFIVEALGDVRRHEVRSQARVTATKMGPPAALPLIELLKYGHEGDTADDERARFIRENAALILGDLLDKRAVAPLKRVAEDEEEPPVVRKYALMSLQKIMGVPVDKLGNAQEYYYRKADRYVRELAGVADEAREADGVVWRLKEGKLVDYQVPRFAWNELMAEQACHDCMDIDAKYDAIYPLYGEVVASQVAEVWELMDIASERRIGRPFTDEEVTDVRSREARLMVEDLMLDSQGELYVSAPALEVPRVPVRRNVLLSALGPVYVYRALRKCLVDAEQDMRELPKLAACILAETAYSLDPDGELLPRPGAAPVAAAKKDKKARAARADTVRRRAEGAPLVMALRFPDERVQYHAAIAIAHMNPPEPFDGADQVVSVLARALGESGPIQILVVEEDPSIRNELKGKLQALDMGVTIAQSAREGLARSTGFPPFDVILVSPQLVKEQNAEWLLDKLMADPRGRGLPVAIITSYPKREEDKSTYKTHENVRGYVPVEDDGKELRELIQKIAKERATPIMSKKRSEDLSVLAAEALCQISPHLARINRMRTEDAGEACIAALQNRIDKVRRPCIDALGRFKIPAAHDKLLELVFDPGQTLRIRVAAIRALGLISPEVSMGRLLEMADKDDEKYILRYLGARAFGQAQRDPEKQAPEKLKEFLDTLRLPLEEKRALKEEGIGF